MTNLIDQSSIRISIHALREESDAVFVDVQRLRQGISIHALREEGDDKITTITATAAIFLSTPSARRATKELLTGILERRNFYPRPPRGGRRVCTFFSR